MPQVIVSLDGVEVAHVYLERDRTTLGRRMSNHIVLSDLAVSGEHCVFELKGLSEVFVEDLGSTNGTYLNGAMVKRHALQDRDVISIGKFKIKYLAANELTDEANKTQAMPLDSALQPMRSSALHASLRVLSGSSVGLEVPVVKAVATFGKPGVALVAIAHRRLGHYVYCIESVEPPTLNGIEITDKPVLLADSDVLVLASTTLQFTLR